MVGDHMGIPRTVVFFHWGHVIFVAFNRYLTRTDISSTTTFIQRPATFGKNANFTG
jgi:hypothetical protein